MLLDEMPHIERKLPYLIGVVGQQNGQVAEWLAKELLQKTKAEHVSVLPLGIELDRLRRIAFLPAETNKLSNALRRIDKHWMCRSWKWHIDTYLQNHDHVIVSDMYMPHDIRYFQKEGGIVLWIGRKSEMPLDHDCLIRPRKDILIETWKGYVPSLCQKVWAELMSKYVNKEPVLKGYHKLECTPGVDRRGDKNLAVM